MRHIKRDLLLFIILIVFTNIHLFADIDPSPRRLATGDFSDDVFDTYDYITGRPESLGKIRGFQIILFPDELVNDTLSLVNFINGNPERFFHNRIGIGFGNGNFGIGGHFNNLYRKELMSDITYNEDITFTDNDNDAVVEETNEIKTTKITSLTNYNGEKTLDFGGGIGFSVGNASIGVGYYGLRKNEILTDYVDHYEYYANYYSKDMPDKTLKSRYIQKTNKDYQHQVILNLGIDTMTRYYGKSQDAINVKKPVFLLETRLIYFEEYEITREGYQEIIDYDPLGRISIPTSLSNKRIYNGITNWFITLPNIEENSISKGYKLHLKPKFNIRANSQLDYNIQGKFGVGLGIKDSYYSKISVGSRIYTIDPTTNYQDIVSSVSEDIQNYKGKGNYLMCGFRLEQIFRPKYFAIGIALDATAEQRTLKLKGTDKSIKTTKYKSTHTNEYKMNNGITDERVIVVESPFENVKLDKKEVNTTVSIPVGFEFELAKYIKLRTGYIYKIRNIYTKTTTVKESDTSTTNSLETKRTVDYDDPSKEIEITYSGFSQNYKKDTTTTITSDIDISNIFSAGFEIILSKSASFNVAGFYDVEQKNGLVILDTKLRF